MYVKEISKNFTDKKVTEILVENKQGLRASFCTLGARISDLSIPSQNGRESVILSLANLEDEATYHTYYGATVGRVAGRIGPEPLNLGQEALALTPNEGTTHLHGGPEGLDLANWDYEIEEGADQVSVIFSLVDPAGHNGYPGNLSARVIHSLDQDNCWTVRYEASSDAPSYWNPTNHVYFNLNGNAQAPITNHILQVEASHMIPLTPAGLPLGGTWALDQHPGLDLRLADQTLGQVIDRHPQEEQLAIRGKGLDHAYVLDAPVPVGQAHALGHGQEVAPQGSLTEPSSGRQVKVWTDRPCAVIYTHNHQVPGLILGGKEQVPYIGVSFETQVAPDAPHHPDMGSIVLTPDQAALSETCFKLTW